MSQPRVPWFIKYRPKRVDDVVDQEEAKAKLISWLNSWSSGTPQKRAVLLYGPPGCGKTSLVEAIARTYGYQLVELNASDARTKEAIERIVKTSSAMGSLFGGKKIILLDEVDGMDPRADSGGIEALLNVISQTRVPIIMTANNPFSQALRPLREVSELIPFKRLTDAQVRSVLQRICASEGIKCEEEALEEIAKRSEGDLRSAINDLEAIAAAQGEVTVEAVERFLAYRNRTYAPYEALLKLFNAKYTFQAKEAVTSTDLSPDEFIQWINEHIPTYYDTKEAEKARNREEEELRIMEERARAYEALSRADVYYGRIIRTQNWDLLSYMLEMMGPGVAFARKTYKYKWKSFKSPEKLKLMAELKKSRELREALAEHLASRLLTSKNIVKTEVIPYLRVIFTNNPKYAARIAKGYELTEELIKWLAGPKANEVISYMKKRAGGGIRTRG